MTQNQLENGQLFREERRRKIVELVNERQKVLVNELADIFDVTTATICGDLRALEDEGLLERTH
ncbi:MAG: DeoR/GlpR transcriptional regulator, partial [Atopobiaceae bacterium]|nr:DeoR/GlpR transcriptional regulator [Atopobiaceae bacterium]